jgi:hypothetical protein
MCRRALPLLASLALALSACIPTYHVWIPTERATARLPDTGQPASFYEMPAGAPPGDVQVATLGVRRVKNGGDTQHLALRMIVDNNSDQDWQLDVREQVLTLSDGERRQPRYAWGAPQPGSPLVTVPARQKVSLDLLYPVPSLKGFLAEFELAWAVRTPAQLVTNRTPFRQEDIQPGAYAWGPYGYGWDYYYPPPFYYPSPFFSLGFATPILFSPVLRPAPVGAPPPLPLVGRPTGMVVTPLRQ